jgi:hypothetical protein
LARAIAAANLRYDPVRDFSPVPCDAIAERSCRACSLPANSCGINRIGKGQPGNLNYGLGPSGASSHLAPELFKSMAGIDIARGL